MAAHKPKTVAPKHQTMPSTPPSKAESKTSRPAKGRDINTPAVPFAPKSPQRKQKKA
jgi:hypothetical protein